MIFASKTLIGKFNIRCTQPVQIQLGEIDINSVEFDLQSRDDIPQLLRGLQDLYRNVSVRGEIFQLLETIIPAGIDAENGRPVMSLWTILVLGILRLNLNCDYDRVHE